MSALTLASFALMPDAGAATRSTSAARAASAPTTAQILAPSAATVPDPLPTPAQVYRCGSTYTARPCGDGQPLDVADPRSQAQRAQGADVAAREKRLAAWLEAGRHERERAASQPSPTRTAASKACTATKKHACAAQAAASQRVARVPKSTTK